MRLSELFTKTRKEIPAEETSKNAQLLIRAGFIHKELAGAYTFLPLGKRVLDNIAAIVREEMNAVGGQEMLLTALQSKELWEQTGRWDDKVLDVWFKTRLNGGGELGLGTTHEEPLSALLKNFVHSYKDLPFLAYQIQTKFRNELRAKSGLLRGREFLMKDLYSFARDDAEHQEIYERVKQAYFSVYKRLGIGEQTYLTFASGGTFSKFSHEFQTITDAGEDTIFLDKEKKIAVNQEVLTDEVLDELELSRDRLEEVTAAEVGNIFNLGTKYSAPFELNYIAEDGSSKPVIMGCYGIGISRSMGVIAELLSDQKGLVWPKSIAPAQVYLASLGTNTDVIKSADQLYQNLQKAKVSVLYDDRDERPGEKFADADLLGIPHRVVVSEKTVHAGTFELKPRTEDQTELLSADNLLKKLVS